MNIALYAIIVYNITMSERSIDIKKDSHQKKLNSIISPLPTADNIDGFAEKAFNQVLNLIDDVIEDYNTLFPVTEDASLRQQEEQAFEYFGLYNIEQVLDTIIEKNNQLQEIAARILSLAEKLVVITPPDTCNNTIQPGDGEYKIKAIINRVTLLLYILLTDYAITPPDDQITKGIVTDTMMRKLPYFTVEVPLLNRIVQACDEEGNVSFIFDQAAIEYLGNSVDDLNDMTKEQKKQLIRDNPHCGTVLRHSESWRYDMSMLLNPDTNFNSINCDQTYKKPTTTIDEIVDNLPLIDDVELSPSKGFVEIDGKVYGTIAAISDILCIDIEVLTKYIRDKRQKYRRYAKDSRDQIIAVYPVNMVENYFHIEVAPKEILSVNQIATKFAVARSIIDKAIEALGIEPIGIYRFKAAVTKGYSPEQQQLIKSWLDDNGYFVEQKPDGFLSLSGMADEFEVSRPTIKKAIEALGIEPIRKYYFGTNIAEGYSPEQQQSIKSWLDENRYVKPPDGFLSIDNMADKYNVNENTIYKAITALGKSLVNVKKYTFVGGRTEGYSPEQQIMIKQWLEDNGYFVKRPKDGYLSAKGSANQMECEYNTFMRVAKLLGIMPIDEAKIGSNIVGVYSPEQRKEIRDHLANVEHFYAEEHPPGYLSAAGVADTFNLDPPLVRGAIVVLCDELSPQTVYKFGARRVPGYSPEQQELIVNHIINGRNHQA